MSDQGSQGPRHPGVPGQPFAPSAGVGAPGFNQGFGPSPPTPAQPFVVQQPQAIGTNPASAIGAPPLGPPGIESPGGVVPGVEPPLDEIPQFRTRRKFPGWLAAFVGIGIGAGGMALGQSLMPREKPKPAPAPVASPEPTASASAAPPPKTPIELAMEGDKAAIAALEKKVRDQRVAAETVALARVSAEAKRAELEEIKRKTELVEKFGRDKATRKRINELARDREVSTDTLAMLAELPGEIGPDILYDLWQARWPKPPKETAELAETLLYAKDVREKASPGLLVALDLFATEDCEKVKKILERAVEQGDKRALTPIVPLYKKNGCGENKRDDCWACLREGDAIKDAVEAVRKRSPP